VVVDGVLGCVAGDDEVGELSFFGEGELGEFALGELAGGPAAGGCTGLAEEVGGVDEDEEGAVAVEVGFEEEGNVPDDGGGWGIALGGGCGAVVAEGEDVGVEEGFEACALGGVGEDEGGDGWAVEGAVGEEDLGAPPLGERLEDLGAAVELGDEIVGRDDGAAEVLELAGVVGLSGGDSAEEADDGYRAGRHVWSVSRAGRAGLEGEVAAGGDLDEVAGGVEELEVDEAGK